MKQEETFKNNKLSGGNRVNHYRPEPGVSAPREKEAVKSEQETIRYLQEQFDVLQTLFSDTSFHVALMDKNFNFIWVNRAYAEGAGQSPEFFVGKNHFVLFPYQENKAIFSRVVESGEAYSVFEKPFEFPDQPERGLTYWDWTLHPIKGVDGEVIGLILGLVDATRRKRAEEAVKIRDRRYKQLLKQSLDGFIRMDVRGSIIESNPAFRDMVGYTEDELKSLSPEALTPVSWLKREEKIFKEMFETGHTPIYEKEYISKEGDIIPVELRTYLTRDEKENPSDMWAFVRDVSEKKEIKEELKGYVDRLEQSNRELAEFAYVASHDLQEPLRKIQAFGDRLLNTYAGELSETGRDYLERMINAATRMRELIEALLSYSRVSVGEENFAEVNLNAALNEALSNLETRIEETGARLEIAELPKVEADPVQMVQLFQNLIMNALKFQRKDIRPAVRISYRISPVEKSPRRNKDSVSGFYEIYVRDNGIGFEEKYREKVFMPLQRLHGRSEYEGVGMGLAICRRIVERHRGTIQVESEPGYGTTFIITLPFTHKP